jgi:hypothetical protein
MLFGYKILIKTDHKNLTHQHSAHASDRVLCQRLLLEEYGTELQYIEGEQNVVADALSRLPTEEIFTFDEADATDFPLNLATLTKKQQTDDYLQLALQQHPSNYVAKKGKVTQCMSTRRSRQFMSLPLYVPLSYSGTTQVSSIPVSSACSAQ